MGKVCRFSYNKIDDSLIISCREQNENIKENFLLDDIIYSLTGKGKIVGLQIKNASVIFSESGLNPGILNKLTDVELIVIPKENGLFVGLKLIASKVASKLALGRVYLPQVAN